VRDDLQVNGVSRARFTVFSTYASRVWGMVERARPEDIDPELAWCRVRGSKDAQTGGARDRIVPVVDLRCALLLACARAHADGGGILLFRRKANFRARPGRGV
jgi:hypothetical protein